MKKTLQLKFTSVKKSLSLIFFLFIILVFKIYLFNGKYVEIKSKNYLFENTCKFLFVFRLLSEERLPNSLSKF